MERSRSNEVTTAKKLPFMEVRRWTEHLCAPLTTEDYIPQPVDFVSPTKWHLAHSTWFFEEFVLKQFVADYKPYDPDFGFLFNSYYNTVGERTRRGNRGDITRPGVEQVYAYRRHVNEHMEQYLAGNPDPSAVEFAQLGLNHEQQHQELLMTDLKYTLSLNPTNPVYGADSNFLADHNAEAGWLKIEEGVYPVGFNSDGFCYDNELGRHNVFLHEFEISKALVTNGEFLEFLNDGGYGNFKHWHDDAWAWVNENDVQHPLYWEKKNGQWFQFTFAGLKPLDPDAILGHISYYEAAAFAQWKGMRLPTEFEWEVAAPHLKWGLRWEHTNSAYLPYPGFTIAPGAVGEYNGKFMVNQMVLRGGSVVTAPGHSRITYRNFFHPHLQWQYSGIRLAR